MRHATPKLITVACVAIAGVILLTGRTTGLSSTAQRAVPASVTAIAPSPTAKPTPPPVWAALDLALVAGDDDTVLRLFDENVEQVEARGRDTFLGLDAVLAPSRPQLIREVDRLVLADRFDDASTIAGRLARRFPNDAAATRRAEAVDVWRRQGDDAEVWTGTIPHLFIHSLIVRSELAFDGDYQDQGYRDYMITRVEFERMLDELWRNNFILIDLHELYSVADDRTVTARELPLPPGKRPMVFSIDDVSYYDYMAGNGFAERLEIGEAFDVGTVMRLDDGSEQFTLTGDAMPILDQFVLAHPDFSLGGAKGIIAVTGYEGAFGYDFSRDQVDDPDYGQRVEAATGIAARLRELGWDFASHSYTHGDWLKSPQSSFGRFTFDAENWEAEVEPVLGETDIYITPFGFDLSDRNARLRYLVEEKGFTAFHPIAPDTPLTYEDDYLRMYRTAVDGYALRETPHLLEPFFNPAVVWDEKRGQVE